MLDNLYRQVILDHYKHRRNFKELKGNHVRQVFYKNPTCGDAMSLFLDIDNGHVKKATFLGEGCSISMASASMMTELIEDKILIDIALLQKAFEDLIFHGNVIDHADLGDCISLQGVHKYKARHNCALMAWQALKKALVILR